jgi:hypothetical protein
MAPEWRERMDTVEGLDAAIRKRFRDVESSIRGTVALFEARAN